MTDPPEMTAVPDAAQGRRMSNPAAILMLTSAYALTKKRSGKY